MPIDHFMVAMWVNNDHLQEFFVIFGHILPFFHNAIMKYF